MVTKSLTNQERFIFKASIFLQLAYFLAPGNPDGWQDRKAFPRPSWECFLGPLTQNQDSKPLQ
jgi:hypothetical protein